MHRCYAVRSMLIRTILAQFCIAVGIALSAIWLGYMCYVCVRFLWRF